MKKISNHKINRLKDYVIILTIGASEATKKFQELAILKSENSEDATKLKKIINQQIILFNRIYRWIKKRDKNTAFKILNELGSDSSTQLPNEYKDLVNTCVVLFNEISIKSVERLLIIYNEQLGLLKDENWKIFEKSFKTENEIYATYNQEFVSKTKGFKSLLLVLQKEAKRYKIKRIGSAIATIINGLGAVASTVGSAGSILFPNVILTPLSLLLTVTIVRAYQINKGVLKATSAKIASINKMKLQFEGVS